MRTSIAGSYDRVGVRRWTRDARGFETWKRWETDERISIDSFPTNSDPFGLGKPAEYLQFGLDALDGSAERNPSGNVIGKLKKADSKPKARAIVVSIRFMRFYVVWNVALDGVEKILCISGSDNVRARERLKCKDTDDERLTGLILILFAAVR